MFKKVMTVFLLINFMFIVCQTEVSAGKGDKKGEETKDTEQVSKQSEDHIQQLLTPTNIDVRRLQRVPLQRTSAMALNFPAMAVRSVNIGPIVLVARPLFPNPGFLDFLNPEEDLSLLSGNFQVDPRSPSIYSVRGLGAPRNLFDDFRKGKFNDPLFFRQNLIIDGKVGPNGVRPQVDFSWLTISTGRIVLRNLDIKGKIQVTAHATIVLENCKLEQILPTNECAIEVFAGSRAILRNCEFLHGNKASVVVRDRSTAQLHNCRFNGSNNTGLLVLDSATVAVKGSSFENCKKFGLYLYRNAHGNIKECQFDRNTKSIFMLKEAKCIIDTSLFGNLSDVPVETSSGGIAFADSSELKLVDCVFRNLNSSSVHAMKNSKVCATNCFFENCKGNAFNFEFSTGVVQECHFRDFVDFPCLAVFGNTTNPVIEDCVIEGSKSFAVVARDASTPILRRIKISDVHISRGIFAFSDFARPIVSGCEIFGGESPVIFLVDNGANALITANTIHNAPEQPIFTTFFAGTVSFDGRANLFDFTPSSESLEFIDACNCILEPTDVVKSGDEEKLKLKFMPSPQMPINVDGLNDRIEHTIAKVQTTPTSGSGQDSQSSVPEHFVCSPCGHSISGEKRDAVQAAVEAGQKPSCEFCSCPINQVCKVFDSDNCCICLSHKADTILLPCGHKVCYEDALNLCSEGSKTCGECRTRIQSFKYDFEEENSQRTILTSNGVTIVGGEEKVLDVDYDVEESTILKENATTSEEVKLETEEDKL